MNIIMICGAAIITAAIAVLIKQYKPEYAMAVNLAAGVLIFGAVIIAASPIFSQLKTLILSTNMSEEYAVILFKCLGICFITQLASDTCKDAGAEAIANKAEMAGKIAILLEAMPLFAHLLNVATILIEGS